MELKFESKTRGLGIIQSSNRTFMELKSESCILISPLNLCSNRTFMELKWRTRRRYLLPVPF